MVALVMSSVGKGAQHVTIFVAVPTGENLVGAEDAGYAVNRDAAAMQSCEIVLPELVFDKEGHRRMSNLEEFACVELGVEGQIADDIGTFVVLADFISRR